MNRGLALIGMFVMAAFVCAAQNSAIPETPKTIINIPFQFYADGNLLPAGTYEFQPSALGTHVNLRDIKGENIVIISVLTSASLRKVNQTEAVFDVVGKDHYLSAFYLKGMDGFAFNGTPEKCSHQVIEFGK